MYYSISIRLYVHKIICNIKIIKIIVLQLIIYINVIALIFIYFIFIKVSQNNFKQP